MPLINDPFKFSKGELVQVQEAPGKRYEDAVVHERIPSAPHVMYRLTFRSDGIDHWATEDRMRSKQ